jgi:mannosylglycerate hydrolase
VAGRSPKASNTVLLGSKRAWIAGDRYRVEAASDGTLRVIDLETGAEHAGLLRFEDEPDVGDLYTFCPAAGARPWRSDARGVERSARVLRRGPVSELEVSASARVAGGRIACRTVARLVRGPERIELETEVDNRARDHRLRVVIPAARAGETVRAEGQFAVVERPVQPAPRRTSWVEPPAPTGHTLGAVALGDLALFTKGLPEYEAHEGELALTLLRCVGLISRPHGLATRPNAAGPDTATPGGQCLGRHRFEYAVRFGALALDETALVREAQDYRFDFLAGPAGETQAPALALGGDPVAFSCLKGAEDGDGLVLRLYNPGPRPARVRVACAAALAERRLDESGEKPLRGRGLTLRGGRIATVRIRPDAQPAV